MNVLFLYTGNACRPTYAEALQRAREEIHRRASREEATQGDTA